MSDYPILGGIALAGMPVAGIYHAGRRVGLAHGDRLLVPSGKNLLRWSDMTEFDGKIRTTVAPDGGMRLDAEAGLGAWCGMEWRIDCQAAGIAPGDTLTVSQPAGESLSNGMLFNIKFFTDDKGSYAVQQNFGWGNVNTFVVPEGTVILGFTVFTNGNPLPAGVSKTLHPQLEKGSARTCWEPPENLRGGGSLRDLNLAGAWPDTAPAWMKLDAWQAEGHTAHTARSETCSTWVSIDTAEATLPAGMYSVRCDGLSSGIACEFRDTGANKLLGYISDDWKTLTVTEPTTVAARLAVSPDWTGAATVTPVILEGDGGG